MNPVSGTPTPRHLALIGGGVRGTAALARFVARLRNTAPPLAPRAAPSGTEPIPHRGAPSRTPALVLHLIDPHPLGSGRIWRATQPHTLVMNTVAAQSTVFDDDTLGFTDRCPGPTFAQWCAGITDGTYSFAPTETASNAASMAELAAHTQAWDSPSRALYGAYLRWAHAHLIAQLPDWVQAHTHAASATRLSRIIHDQNRRFSLELSSGTSLTVDGALFAVGWLSRPSTSSIDIDSESPIDQHIDRIQPGESVAVRGLGMGFTDLLSLVTESRGGRFEADPQPHRPFALRYVPSGNEPTLFAGSRSGIPFLAKPAFGAVPPAPELVSLRAWIPTLSALRTAGPLDFAALVDPLIERDSVRAHAATLAAQHPEQVTDAITSFLSILDAPPTIPDTNSATQEHLSAVLAADADRWQALYQAAVPDPAHRFDASRCDAPIGGDSATTIEDSILARMVADAEEASLGARSATKMGWHAFQAARAAIVPLTDFWGSSEESAQAHRTYLMRAGLVGSGPPLFRVEQLLAAHAAGVVHFVGSELRVVSEDSGRFVTSARTPETRVPVHRVADAFLPVPDARACDDPLITSLLAQGIARIAPTPCGYESPAIDITPESSQLVNSSGSPEPGLHSVGLMHEQLRQFTIIAPIPNARSTVLREIDAAVGALLGSLSTQ